MDAMTLWDLVPGVFAVAVLALILVISLLVLILDGARKAPRCPVCGGIAHKVIFCGLPGHFCEDEHCNVLSGLAAWAPPVATETEDGPAFAFVVYEGSYWVALWRWLFGRR